MRKDPKADTAVLTRGTGGREEGRIQSLERGFAVLEEVGRQRDGALCGGTGLVSLSSLQSVLAEIIPPYRAQHVELNERALGEGYRLAADVAETWPHEVRT
jgi:hypothetical protein